MLGFPSSNHGISCGSLNASRTARWRFRSWTRGMKAAGKLIALFAVTLVVGNGQCIAFCPSESCIGVPRSQASVSRRQQVPPCHRNRNAPTQKSSTRCSADLVVADAAQPTIAKITANIENSASFAAVLHAPPIALRSTDRRSPEVPSPPNQPSRFSTIRRL